jgi:acyl carrier protein
MSSDAFSQKISDLTHGQVDANAAIDPESWDSVDVLDLLAAIDEVYSVTIPLEQLNACRTVGELRELIRAAAAG